MSAGNELMNRWGKMLLLSVAIVLVVPPSSRKAQAMKQDHIDPLKPDAKQVLDEMELKNAVSKVAGEIEKLKSRYAHLKKFRQEEAISRPNLIWYKNGIQIKPNPEYRKEILNRKKQTHPVKKPLPPEEIPVFSRQDGVEIYIEFIEMEMVQTSQRIIFPELWIGNYAVEMMVDGASTSDIRNIKTEISKILMRVKKSVE